jgi:purine-nucleoside phosphorylase
MSRLPQLGWTLRADYSERLDRATVMLREVGFASPTIALVLGSGLGNVVDAMEVEVEVDFAAIPGFRAPTVAAHQGRLVQAQYEGHRALILQGRNHAYEGIALDEVVFPVATLARLGASTLVLTNAAGGLHPDMRAGDLMAITDILDLHLGDATRRLFVPPPGAKIELELRAASAKQLFDRQLSLRLVEIAAEAQVPLHTGTYVSLWGPNYELPAEIGMLRRVGAAAVGMSTGPEAALAHQWGMRVVGISCITNVSVEVGGSIVTHDEVIEVGAQRRDDFGRLLLAALGPLSELSA